MSESPRNRLDPNQPGTASRPGQAFSGMQYLDAYAYVFGSPNWVMNVILGAVCQLIPIIGPMVFMGYQFDIIESLQREPRGSYPDFCFDRFADYLKRGLWPFLVSFIVNAIVIVPVALVCYVIGLVVALASHGAGQHAGPVVTFVGMGGFSVLFMALLIAVGIVSLPMWLRAGLTQDFAEAFRFDFIRDFIRTVWKEMLLTALFLFGTSLVVTMTGMLLCCVGIYPAGALVMLAIAHLNCQLYQAYLSRGGTPIPVKSTVASQLG